MSDYISRQLAIISCPNVAEETLKSLPSADVAPVKHGKWLDHIEEDYIGNGEYGYIVLPKCSVCGSLNSKKCHFCPVCGAKMEVDGDV